MKTAIALLTSLSLFGCAGSLQLSGFALRGPVATAPAAASGAPAPSGASRSSAVSAAPAAPTQPVDRHFDNCSKGVEDALALLPKLDGVALLNDLMATYPQTDFVHKRQFARDNCQESIFSKGVHADEAKAKLDELDGKVLEALKLPHDAYRGHERKKLEKLYSDYIAQFTNKKAIKVVFLFDDFDRNSGSDWVGNELRHYDQGFLQALAVVKKDNRVAEVWKVDPRKDYLDGGKVKFDVYVPEHVSDMLVGNVRVAAK